MRIKGWSKLSSPELWKAWLAEFKTVAEAEGTAVWIANRLVKTAARSTRRKFYEIKEIFLSRYAHCLIEGRVARVEQKQCWDCDGSGDAGYGEGCEKCESTGIYSERTLYAHHLEIEGVKYSFHSYAKPKHLVDAPGEDLESYGGKFTDEEIKELKLPLSALVRALRYAAMAKWGGEHVLAYIDETGCVSPGAVEFHCHCAGWPGRKPGQHHSQCRMRMSA